MKDRNNYSRRNYLMSLPVFAAAGSAGLSATGAEEDSDKKKSLVEYLFVQTAEKVECKGDIMTLRGISPTTLFFSDRPDRITGHGRTTEYVENWTKGEDSFEAEPPNAALCIVGEDDKHIDEVVVVLKNPVLKDGGLSYQVEVLDGTLPESAGACSLFVDVVGRPLTPRSVAGVARRTSRRTTRRVLTYGGY